MQRLVLILVLALAVVLLLGTRAQTQAAIGGYALEWSAISAGGGVASRGSYSVVGTIGQPGAGVASGGSYTLVGGFAGGTVPVQPARRPVYLPLVRR
jgi:hypothetical protein